jgi:acetoin utilization deacetylase AcuC-like enzyme
MSAAMVMVEQRAGGRAVQPWILDGQGRRMEAQDHDRRLLELRAGLVRHPGVRSAVACTSDDELERALSTVHERGYLRALARVRSPAPVLMEDFAAPGMAADTPVCAEVAAAAFEGVRAAIAAARLIADGARFAYVLCGPPGHHAGPGWLGGCCYLNNAAAAAHTLHAAGVGPVGILDLDIHYPNGTAAIAARMADTSLHSLHAWPVVNAPAGSAHPCGERERMVEFSEAPSDEHYLAAVASSIDALRSSAAALVLSLGYDTVAGDPHGSWCFAPDMFTRIGQLLAASGLPVCVVQEGGYALQSLGACSYAFASGLLGARANIGGEQ